jgi:hypothetical protein
MIAVQSDNNQAGLNRSRHSAGQPMHVGCAVRSTRTGGTWQSSGRGESACGRARMRVELENEEGTGASCAVRLPIAVAKSDRTLQVAPPPLRSGSLLRPCSSSRRSGPVGPSCHRFASAFSLGRSLLRRTLSRSCSLFIHSCSFRKTAPQSTFVRWLAPRRTYNDCRTRSRRPSFMPGLVQAAVLPSSFAGLHSIGREARSDGS